jgi:hypothetical protein
VTAPVLCTRSLSDTCEHSRFVVEIEASRMPLNENQKITADQMKAMLGAPPLIRGESEEAYWQWWYAFVEQYQPESLSDWLEVNDLAIKHWEQYRLQRSNSALVDGALIAALKTLLRPLHAVNVFNPIADSPGDAIENNATNIAHDYYAGNDKDRRRAREKVEAWGISDDQIIAEAMQLRGNAMLLLDRMDNYRAGAKRALQKELDRRSEARRSRPDQSESQN